MRNGTYDLIEEYLLFFHNYVAKPLGVYFVFILLVHLLGKNIHSLYKFFGVQLRDLVFVAQNTKMHTVHQLPRVPHVVGRNFP